MRFSRASKCRLSCVVYILYPYIIPTESLVYWKENEERRRSRSIGAAAELRYLDFDWSEEHSRSMMIGCLEIYKVFFFCEQARRKKCLKGSFKQEQRSGMQFLHFLFFSLFSHIIHTSHDAATFSSQQQHHHRRALGQFDFFFETRSFFSYNSKSRVYPADIQIHLRVNNELFSLAIYSAYFLSISRTFFCSCDLCAL